MRFNYAIHPILRGVQSGRLEHVVEYIGQYRNHNPELIEAYEHFAANSGKIKSNIKSISKSFYNDVKSAQRQILNEHTLEYCYDLEESGVLLLPTKSTVVYFIDKRLNVRIYWFAGKILSGYVRYNQGKLSSYTISELGFKKISSNEGVAASFFVSLMAMIVFIKYTDVKVKELPAGQKVKGVQCEYGMALNQTHFNIQYIHSTWITDLRKSDGFDVRGHFRFHACGRGYKDRKLIWINKHQKQGYYRKHDRPDE